MGVIIISACPVCASSAISHQLTAEDYTVSHQTFEIWQCAGCSLRFTQGVPDAASVGNYYQSANYISHTDTSEGIVNKLYHFVRKTTLKRKRRLVAQTTGVQKGSVLDIGAGTGAFAQTMLQAGWAVTGLEPDTLARQRALALHGLHLQDTSSLFRLPAQGFDAITMWHVLEHVHELQAYIEQIKILLKEKGRALIAVPNYTCYDAQLYGRYWAAYDVPRHLYHFSPKSLETLVRRHGFTLEEKKPMWFDSFYISLLSSKYKNGKTNWLGALWSGGRSNLKAAANKNYCSSLIYILKKN